jgi:hypothetical protein
VRGRNKDRRLRGSRRPERPVLYGSKCCRATKTRRKQTPLKQKVNRRQVVYCVVLCVQSSSLYQSLSRVPVFPFTLLYHTDAILILSLRKEVHPSARTPECHLKSTIKSLSRNRLVSVKSTTLNPGGLHRRRRRTDATQISR